MNLKPIKETKNLFLFLALVSIFSITSVILMGAWEGLFTEQWITGISVEQTSTALNYKHYGLLRPYFSILETYLHLPPLYSWLTYVAIKATGWIQAGELVSFIFSLLTLFTVYKITKVLGYENLKANLIILNSPKKDLDSYRKIKEFKYFSIYKRYQASPTELHQ